MIRISEEVKNAIREERPVVALETTLVTHGLPAPRGLETARAAEAAVRKSGALPATIGVLDGEVIVGLSDSELEKLAKLGMKAVKASSRDLGALVATKKSGSTTVGGTLVAALRAGIRVFATGGIGGVHRDWQKTADVSSDLFTIARTPIAVVCAGFKSILDVPATLETLETWSVPVVGFGTTKLPGFYVRETEFRLDHEIEDAEQAAIMMREHWADLGRIEGILFCNPPPAKTSLAAKDVEPAVAEAVAAAAKERVSGKALTPFLLDLVVAKLGDKALDANTALIVHNAKVAGEIAVEFAGGKVSTRRRMGY